ncbi:MAG: hypothetical protein M3Y54_01640 [Bacteroidota bacterium]|nr:hypothetical protein [Bacteroidota bacterium]
MKQYTLLCLGVALLAACSKGDDIINCGPSPNPDLSTGTLAEVRKASPALQTFTFDLGQPQSLRTLRGATVSFGAGVFLLPNGTVATGQAQLRLREIYDVPDMLLADLPTLTYVGFNNRRVLLSGGEFNLQVWQGSIRLRLAGNVAGSSQPPRLVLSSPLPTANPDTARMLLWNQPGVGPALRDSAGWQLVYGPAAGPTSAPIPVPATAGYYAAALPLDSIGYWNIDRIWPAYQSMPSGIINVEVANATTATGTRVYFRPVGLNGLARSVPAYPSPTRWYSTLPSGVDVVAVVIQERAGHLYFGTQRVTTAAGLVVTPTLEALSVAEIVRRIRLL